MPYVNVFIFVIVSIYLIYKEMYIFTLFTFLFYFIIRKILINKRKESLNSVLSFLEKSYELAKRLEGEDSVIVKKIRSELDEIRKLLDQVR